ncbi:MAG TPA: rhodanese-like domain-containing protein [Kofleriaceae bacterium]|nr:rhodanese-like domain-containing protein [Kofleriaceae bacterium]
MTKFLSTLFLLSIGALAVSSCDAGQGDGQSGANLESEAPKIKDRGPPGLPYGICKGVTMDAQLFFQTQLTGSEREVFAAELKDRMDTGQPTMIVDVRPIPEFGAAHIPTSVNMPLDMLFTEGLCSNGKGKQCDGFNDDQNCKPVVLPTDGTPIVLVSSNGHAASLAAGVLATLGYNVYVLRFGMISWAKSTDVQIQRADKTQRLLGLGGPLEL